MKLVTDTKKVELYHWCIGDGLRRGNFFQVGNAAWIHWLHTAVFTGHSTILADELSLCWAVLSYLKFYLPLMSPGISLCPLLQWAPAGTHHTQHNLPYASELQKHFLHMQMTAVVYVAQRSNESLSLISSEAPRGGSAHPALGCPAGAECGKLLYTPCAIKEEKQVTLERELFACLHEVCSSGHLSTSVQAPGSAVSPSAGEMRMQLSKDFMLPHPGLFLQPE